MPLAGLIRKTLEIFEQRLFLVVSRLGSKIMAATAVAGNVAHGTITVGGGLVDVSAKFRLLFGEADFLQIIGGADLEGSGALRRRL